MMSNTNGFHPPSTSMAYNETSKRLPSTSSTSSTSSNSTTATNKRLKAKLVVSTVNETRPTKKHKTKKANSTKKLKQSSSHSRHLYSHPILHHHPNKSSENIPSIAYKIEHRHHHHHHHHHVINNDHCDSCGELYGEMISCDTCPATFHLLCANPPLSREDVPKGSYFCENCRAKTAEEELNTKDKQIKTTNLQTQKPFLFDPKTKLQTNGFKKNPQRQSTLEQIKIPTASNGRSLIQPSGEIKFRATNNTTKIKPTSSLSNLKRKRLDSSSSPPSIPNSNNIHPIKIPTTQIEALRRLLISCRPEEFRGPSLPFDDPTYNRDNYFQKNSLTWQKYCFICRKSSVDHIPSIHCDYCPLTYHLDCLTPPMTSLPSSTDKWMCPNHIEPILDRYLFKKKNFSTSERVKIYRQYSQIEHKTIIQEFTHMRQTKNYLVAKTIDNRRLERIDISQIPKVIEQFYFNANTKYKQICEEKIDHDINEEECVQTFISLDQSSSAYDPCVWDTLQAILNHTIDGQIYEFSSIVDDSLSIENDKISRDKKSNILDTIDTLLNALNEPTYSIEHNKTNHNGLSTLLAAADSCLTNENSSLVSQQIPTSLANSLSLLIDLSQFRLSHAALIHTRSKHIIYIRKQVIWFGSSISNDICLKDFNHQQTCQYITERHACLYYDRKRNIFELLNYSEYGTIVNGLRYGLGNLSDDESDDDDDDNIDEKKQIENENLQKCFCLTKPSYHSAWDGPAQIEQGTVVQIGCHEFLFYRHIVR